MPAFPRAPGLPHGFDLFDALVLLAMVMLGVGAGLEWGVGWGLMAPVPVMLFVGLRAQGAADEAEPPVAPLNGPMDQAPARRGA